MYTKIKWERHENRKLITQCHRCQHFGHATSNCFREPRCVKCEEAHLTKDCTKDENTAATCCNCKGKHPANYRNCPVYLKKLEIIAKRNTRIQQILTGEPAAPEAFTPAPPPATNPWTSGAAVHSRGPDFPPLPPPLQSRRQRPQTQTAERRPDSGLNPPLNNQVTVQAPSAPAMNQNLNLNIFSELTSEMNQLNSMINLNNLLMFVKDLIKNLMSCPPDDKGLVAFTFIQNIKSYNI